MCDMGKPAIGARDMGLVDRSLEAANANRRHSGMATLAAGATCSLLSRLILKRHNNVRTSGAILQGVPTSCLSFEYLVNKDWIKPNQNRKQPNKPYTADASATLELRVVE